VAVTAHAVDEGARARALRVAEDLLRRAFLVNQALVHVEHAIGDIAGEVHLVGDDDHRHALACKAPDHRQHLAHHRGIERRGGLVEEDHLRLHREAAGNRHALLLAARQLVGERMCTRREAHHAEQIQRLGRGLGARHALQAHRCEREVVQHAEMREEIERLEDHVHFLAQPRHIGARRERIDAIDADAAGTRLLEQVQTAQEGTLARARGADHGDDLAARNVRADVTQHRDIAIALGQFFDMYHSFTPPARQASG
jgi:hypothetical protein